MCSSTAVFATALLRGSFDESIELIPLHLRMMKYLKFPDGAKEQVSMAKEQDDAKEQVSKARQEKRRLVWAEELSNTKKGRKRGGLEKSDLL